MEGWKNRGGKSQRGEERSEKIRKSEKKEGADARKGRKVAIHRVFPMICGSGGSKSRLAEATGAEPCGQMRDEKLHAFVARNTFPSQKQRFHTHTNHVRTTLEMRCRKNARHCGAKRVSQ